ncbi:MAG: tRNA epoxyqueuosine(34) reductase QueG, partial [bacterium]
STDLFYPDGRPREPALDGEGRGWISRYAWGEDYHRVLARRLETLEKNLREQVDAEAGYRSYCDTGPISEKAWAASAGLGWQGKHTNIINQKLGSWLFLAEILTTLDLRPDTPATDHCGSCTRCLDACPTQAFPKAYELDATRCISYLTIEKRGTIPPELADSLGANVYGCDICQDVCPWNRSRVLSTEPVFEARPGLTAPSLNALLALDEATFAQSFKDSAIRRTKVTGLRRNTTLAAAHSHKQGPT